EAVAGLLIEICHCAGLLATTGDTEPEWLPTSEYDLWLTDSPPGRWSTLAQAWLRMPRMPWLIGRRDDRDKVIAPLSFEVGRTGAPAQRRWVLRALAEAAPGSAPSRDSVIGLLRWRAPRRAGARHDEIIGALLEEAETLGVTGRGGLTSYGRALGRGEDPSDLVAGALPEPVDHVLVQADLTVVAPGPLEPELAQEMNLVADVESAGGATVYRVTEGTVRRAMDVGRSADELHALFGERSRTPVPQSLTYLIDDVARRHGTLRVGTASAYLRCDDTALLASIVAERGLELLRLRRIAPTVLLSPVPIDQVLDLLRSHGHAPVAETADGVITLTRPQSRRAKGRVSVVRRPSEPPLPTDEQLNMIVRQVRAGDKASRQARSGQVRSSVPGVTTAATLTVLQNAVRAGTAVWLGYVNAQGASSQRIVEPVQVGGGFLQGFDHKRQEVRTFALHRITSVAALEDAADPAE
ncbi:MAG TPA: helicase C-terminal domain-containing protein, partial [Mycobacteriales bacterium]|nr:helicase C-terminal domain-containing protein [Mycobacteriales bacterium]